MDPKTDPSGVELSDSKRRAIFSWGDGAKTSISYRDMRIECRCAACVSELTGERILDPATIPETIGIQNAEQVGLYGIRFDWSDGHTTGIYTWEKLREISS